MTTPVPAELGELHERHVALAQRLVGVLAEAGTEWDRCRLMVQWFAGGDAVGRTRYSVRTLLDDRMGSFRWPRDDRQMLVEFHTRFQELTGNQLARFRLTVDADGHFDVEYKYDEVLGAETWLWPDEDGYLGPAELKARDFRLV